MEKNFSIHIYDGDDSFAYQRPGDKNSFHARVRVTGPNPLTHANRDELSSMFVAALETAAERDHLLAVNAELVKALETLIKASPRQYDAALTKAWAAITRARG